MAERPARSGWESRVAERRGNHYGVLWAVSSTTYYFSAMSNIEYELGQLGVF